MESSDNAGRGAEEPVVGEEILSPSSSSTIPVSEPVSVEFIESEKGEEGSGLEVTEAAVEQSVSLTEEVTHAAEALAVNPDESVAVDTSSHEREVKLVPPPDPMGELPRETTGAPCADTEGPGIAVAPAPLSEHRASWRNCCGLFDVFMGSRR